LEPESRRTPFLASACRGAGLPLEACGVNYVIPQNGNTCEGARAGVIGGVHAGYNWQIGHVVFGPEANFEGTSLNRTNNCLVQDAGVGNVTPGACFPPSCSFNTQLPRQASIRGRLGYAWGNTLIYATGGVAFTEVNTTYSTIAGYAPLRSQSFSQTLAGGTVGAGLEYAFNGHWIGRLEYRYANFGTFSNAITSGGGFWNGYTERVRLDENTVRVGVSYLFNGPIAMPILTK